MKRKLIISFAIVALCSAAVNTFVTSSTAQSGGVDLTNVEALSICEVSADPELNKGFCVKEYCSDGEVCVGIGTSGSPRCSGNIK